MTDVPVGYKQTEIGIIPNDWEVSELGNISDYVGGAQPPLSYFSTQKREGYIRLIQIRDYKTDNFIVYIPQELARKTCSADDIMIGRYGPPIFQILRGIEGAYNVALLKAIPNENKLDKEFFYYTLKRHDLFLLIDLLSRRTSGQTGVDLVGLRGFQIALPPLPEQQAIATTLSDMDELISNLDKLIEKKKNIKKGAMQKLLSPKDGWIETTLGGVCPFQRGQMLTSDNFVYGDIPVIAGGKTPAGYHNKANRKGTTITISGSGANAGYVNIYREPIFATDCFTVSEGKSYDINFIYYLLLSRQVEIYGLQTGGAQPHVHPCDIEPMEVSVPPTTEEQQEIATILSDMDKEIEALEEKKAKYEQIKQGAMQKLLTGKIRLV